MTSVPESVETVARCLTELNKDVISKVFETCGCGRYMDEEALKRSKELYEATLRKNG